MKCTIDHECWVLHSPCSDGTWRGIEKCAADRTADVVLLFRSKTAAEQFAEEHKLIEFVPVMITLTVPAAGAPLHNHQ